MTSEMLGRIVRQQVHETLEENADIIAKEIYPFCKNTETVSGLTVSMQLSIELAVQIIIRALETAGVIGLPEDDSPILWVHKSDDKPN